MQNDCRRMSLDFVPPLVGTNPVTQPLAHTRIGTGGTIVPNADAYKVHHHFALSATSENQAAILSANDVLWWNPKYLHWFDFDFKMDVALATNEFAILGLASAHNATPDSVTNNLWLKFVGGAGSAGLRVYLECDNNTTDLDDQNTLVDITAATWHHVRFAITASPDAANAADVKIYMTTSFDTTRLSTYNNKLLLPDSTFNIRLATTQLQPYFRLEKASGTTTPEMDVADVGWSYDRA